MPDVDELLQATVAARVAPDARIVAVRERSGGEQGYSGATLGYYDVTYARAGGTGQVALVVKDAASLPERRTQMWLSGRGLPVPFSHTLDLTTDAPAPLCMAHAGEKPPMNGETARHAARALAAIHAAGMGRGDELPWVPRADPAFFAGWIVGDCWRRGWSSVLAGGGLVDGYGRHAGPPELGGDFAGAFAAFTQPLEDVAARFVRDMTALWDAGDTLTLIHADFHTEHLRLLDGRATVIDWGQARYGSLYADVPNYFSREHAPLYRDALAALGHDIPPDEFLAGYDAVSPYPGFKYFGIGLWDWCYGDPPHREDAVRYWINMVTRPQPAPPPHVTPMSPFPATVLTARYSSLRRGRMRQC